MANLTLTDQRDSYMSGTRTRSWAVARDGVLLGYLSKGSEAFAQWRFLEAIGCVAGEHFTFKNKGAAMAFLETFRAR